MLSLLVVASIAGCARGDECESGEYRCDGDVASNCRLQIDDAHYLYWRSRPVSRWPVPDRLLFCVLHAKRDARAQLQGRHQTSCVDSSVVVCRSGYAVSKIECAPPTSAAPNSSPALAPFHLNPQSAFCIPNGRQAFCAAEAEPNENCDTLRSSYTDGERLSTACDGNDSLACVNGYVVSRDPCDAVCIVDAGKSYCASSADPDPQCPLSDNGSQHCDGNVVVGCSANGYRISEEQCTETMCYQLSNCPAANPSCTATVATCIRKDRVNGGAR